MDELDELDDVVRAVDEEAGDDAVEVIVVLVGAVHFKKVPGGHREIGRLGQVARVHVRKRGRFDDVIEAEVVGELVDPRVEGEAVGGLALVEHEVGGEQHEQAELVALTFVTSVRWKRSNLTFIDLGCSTLELGLSS